MKRRFMSLLCILLSVVFFATACNSKVDSSSSSVTESINSGSVEESGPTEPEYDIERGEGQKKLTIYFYRAAGYDNCDIWLWHAEAEGRGNLLYPCEYGAKMVILLPSTIDEVGFIIRTNCSEPGGTTWGTATKDGTDSDRSIALKGDETVIYTKAGDAKSYSSTDGGKTLKEIKYISIADMQTTKTIKYVLSSAMKFSNLSDYQLVDGDGNAVAIEKVSSLGATMSNGVITTVDELDLAKAYTLTLPELDPVSVVPNTYFNSDDFKENYNYDGELGVIFDGNVTTFKVWAPTASKVTLNLFENGATGEAYSKVVLTRGEKGVWEYATTENVKGKYYTYNVVTSAGDQEAVDPYAKSAGLNGNRGMILDLDTTDPDGWKDEPYNNPAVTNYTDAVIWEVHVRDFSNKIASSKYKGKFLAFTETGLTNEHGLPVGVDYLKELGITHVHLLPSYDYATVDEAKPDEKFNWGYDPKNYNVPEGSYSTDPTDGSVRVKEFKQMVQALHNEGISVVMDVVYNHTYDLNSSLNKIVPYYYYRYQVNGAPSNGSGCGNETASDRYMFRKFMLDSVKHWQEEMGVDGFRFDLMGLHDTVTMKAIEAQVHAYNPEAIIYGEGWTGGSTPLTNGATLANIRNVNTSANKTGVAMFNDVLRDAIKGSTNGNDTGFATGAQASVAGRIKFGVIGGTKMTSIASNPNGWYAYHPTNVINYCSAHDNLSLWDKICYAYGEDSSTLDMRLKRNALAGAIVQTTLGIPFMQAGEEMLRAKKNLDGTYNHNSYNSSDEVNNLKWDFSANSPEYTMMQYYKGLIAFRKSSAALRSPVAQDRGTNVISMYSGNSGTLLAFKATDIYSGEQVFVIYNAGLSAANVTLPDGSWNLYVNGTTAGTVAIESGVTGSVTVTPVSCYVYRKA
ncbi:MAG: type I pullulanase [Clostridia bacterium]|nr:type I pullulanase [Clostridia bacterium]